MMDETKQEAERWASAEEQLHASIARLERELRGVEPVEGTRRERVVRTFLPRWWRLDVMLLVWIAVETAIFTYLIVGVVGVNNSINSLSQTSAQALCAYRANLHREIVSTQDYLRKHHEKKILGIPRSEFVTAVHREQIAYKAFVHLSCPRGS